ncbi:uncharacterized protein EI90DRAFT_262493 [Cantharellus anzutake]|uniref:uncharacterized protein n=1 Tax=Cantharellus anzutake TaxID=1750568 RepID=UPI001903EF8B|nr:uncharacterized protein EI90DRAFT_262493 [Cantharellus anzutake]KAF8335822.1 hypothetical protein EI90DRAFT_262493 [Cantharellus anzutake]
MVLMLISLSVLLKFLGCHGVERPPESISQYGAGSSSLFQFIFPIQIRYWVRRLYDVPPSPNDTRLRGLCCMPELFPLFCPLPAMLLRGSFLGERSIARQPKVIQRFQFSMLQLVCVLH